MATALTSLTHAGIGKRISDRVAFPQPVKKSKHLILLLGLALLTSTCGARTGLRVPTPTTVTFKRAVGSPGAWAWEIYQVSPSSPDGQPRVTGVNVLIHDMHPGGDWTAYSTQEGLFMQDWRGLRTLRVSGQNIAEINWTSDARRLAFTQRERIWVVNSGGSDGPTPLTDEPTDPTSQSAMSPSWTPDASRLFFIRYRTGLDGGGNPIAFQHEIWSVAGDGSDPRLVRAGSPAPSQPRIAVSRDGSAVLYTAGFDPSPSIVRLDLASGATSTLIANASQPAFSGTGRYLAFVRGGRIWTCTYDGSSCVDEHQVSNGTSDHNPSWVGS